MLQGLLLGQLQKEVVPVSTRQLALKLGFSWHIVQEQCLELLIKKKIDRIETTASHLWTAVGRYSTKSLSLSDDPKSINILEKKLLAELEKSITKELIESLEKNIQSTLASKRDQLLFQHKKQESRKKEEVENYG